MCAIIDNSVVGDLFRTTKSKKLPAAHEFLRRINDRRFPIVAGGKLLSEELGSYGNFLRWWQQAVLSGHGRHVSDVAVRKETRRLERQGGYRSNDPHVLALARVSGARLLYTNDRDLQLDFKNTQLISSPAGKIYTTLGNRNGLLRKAHRNLLSRTDLCK